MSSRSRLADWVVVGMALAPLLGCATPARRAEADLRKRQARTHYEVAVDHIQNGRIERALRELLAAERLDPRDAVIQHSLGVTYYQKRRAVEAERHLRRALQLRADYHEAQFNLSVLLLREGRWAECISETQRLIDDPTFAEPWRALTTRGWCEFKSGNVAEARRLLVLSRDYEAGDWSTLLNLGILEADQGNRRQAVELFEQVLTLHPGPGAEAEANYRLGGLYAALGQRERAVKHLTAAVEKAPNGPWGKESEEELKRLR